MDVDAISAPDLVEPRSLYLFRTYFEQVKTFIKTMMTMRGLIICKLRFN